MTTFDKITQSPEALAAFITTLIEETENKMLDRLDAYGIQCSIVQPAYAFREANNLAMLLEVRRCRYLIH